MTRMTVSFGGGSIDHHRALRAGVFLVWAGFFAWLRLSGEMTRYLGPRTYWVVTLGALVLGAAALVQLATLQSRAPSSGISLGDAAGALVLVLPLLLVLAVPRAELGSLAASRRDVGDTAASAAFAGPPAPRAEISFVEIHYGSLSGEYAASAGMSEGIEVDLTGFVTEDDALPTGYVELTRFYVSCCAADAIPYSAWVRLPEQMDVPPEDTWLQVNGTLAQRDGRWTVDAVAATTVEAPETPYLY